MKRLPAGPSARSSSKSQAHSGEPGPPANAFAFAGVEERSRRFPAPAADIRGLATEKTNPSSTDFDIQSSLEIARVINFEDRSVPLAIAAELTSIAEAIDAIARAFRRGGRLIYVGAGSSGRLGALDAAECPPTFNADPKLVQFLIAGGKRALGRSVEGDEDSPALGRRDMARKRPSPKDVVAAISASGHTPYTVAALEYARERGATTVCITANPHSPVTAPAQIPIVVDVGPEVVAGSTRMKAGTMQKLVLNMLTTGAFTRLGYVYGNLMVNVHLKNRKLVERAIGIVQQVTGVDRESALTVLRASGGSVPVALVMIQGEVSRGDAERRLKRAEGNVRRAIEDAGYQENRK